VQEVNASQARLGAALVPGAYLVEAYPFLRYMPGYLSELRRQHQIELTLSKTQIDSVRAQMVRGTSSSYMYSNESEQAANKEVHPCFAKMIIERQEEYGLTDNEIAYLAGSMFGAGAGTVSFGSRGFFVFEVIRYRPALPSRS
jgi:hypothetical protein